MSVTNLVLVFTAVATSLITGLLYAYSCSVNPGLARLPASEYIAAMNSINKAILNPFFFASFLGALILLPLSTYLNYGQPDPTRFFLLLAATVVYAAGVFGITAIGNVPLNEMLARFSVQAASVEEIATQRAKFEAPWNKLHTIRTIASIVSLILVIITCVVESKQR